MKRVFSLVTCLFFLISCGQTEKKDYVDCVDPYMGNISHLLVPTFPTVHLPNSFLRVYPERRDYTSELLEGLPLVVTSHRGSSAFKLSPSYGDFSSAVISYSYDQEKIRPYCYEVTLDEADIQVRFVPSHQSAIYELDFDEAKGPACITLSSQNGQLAVEQDHVSGYQNLANNTKVYLYMVADAVPVEYGICSGSAVDGSRKSAAGKNVSVALRFREDVRKLTLRYGISFISSEQAKSNMEREVSGHDMEFLKDAAMAEWNRKLGAVEVEGGTEKERTVFYTSLYRICERPVCISEDGRYFSAFDGKVHEDDGRPFYTDDWIWDTYRAAHPMRALVDQELEEDVLDSYLRMAEQMGNMWMPTFPEITGDSRRMNSNHAVATVADAIAKGLHVDARKAYEACRKGIEEKTLAPWSGKPSGWIDEFYDQHGYIPALRPGEEENDPNVHSFEKRQPIAVTLGTSYDEWCLSRIADYLGLEEDAQHYLECSYNYRNVFNPETGFFHPKDKDGNWIEPFDYSFPGGMGAREYYGENNGWVYRWDVPHNPADLINLMGGREQFISNLDQTFREPLGRSKYAFYAKLPDHTGNVGQFSMANEPSLHVPYLYNYAGAPWKTQKCIRKMLRTWFRDDLMGVPGDEDGGGMSAFVAFSSLGFYPVTPGMPVYNIGSPLFTRSVIHLSNGKDFIIEAENASEENKYIQSATLNGREWNQPWFSHSDMAEGGKLVLVMGDKPNKTWGNGAVPPSAQEMR